MKIEAIKTKTTEVFIETNEGSVSVTGWSNCEGANIIVTTKDLSVKMAGCLRWEEIDNLIVALAVARADP